MAFCLLAFLTHDVGNSFYDVADCLNRLARFFLELFGGIFLFTGHHISSGTHSGGDSCTGEDGRKVHCHNDHS